MAANLVLERSLSYWLKKKKVPQGLWELLKQSFNPSGTALDLGCAGGRLCKSLVPYFEKVFAIDRSKNLLKNISPLCPEIAFVHGDFGLQKTWKKINQKINLITSDCAVRKDYVDLKTLADLCFENLENSGFVIFRMQGIQDMSNIFAAHVRRSLFYNEQEIKSAFEKFELKIHLECYVQKFSTNNYLKEYLKMININDTPENSLLNLPRHYFIVEARKK